MMNQTTDRAAVLPDAKKVVVNGNGPDAILVMALVEFVRASRRAKLAEVAALERFERTLLTITGLH